MSLLRGAQRENAALDQSPFRAAEWWWFYPRMWGMVALGNLALLGASPVDRFFFGASDAAPPQPPSGVLWHVVLTGGALLATWFLVQTDVFKQNRGLMTMPKHARPRACRLARILLFNGTCIAVLSAWTLGRLHLCGGCDGVVAIVAHGVVGTLVGIILQWFWGNFSATEPV